MSNARDPLRCDGVYGCTQPVAYECVCRRCTRELPDECWHCCAEHKEEAERTHIHVRERTARWSWIAQATEAS